MEYPRFVGVILLSLLEPFGSFRNCITKTHANVHDYHDMTCLIKFMTLRNCMFLSVRLDFKYSFSNHFVHLIP